MSADHKPAPVPTGSSDITGIYRNAGFGGAVKRGSHPALVVVDFTCGFTMPSFPTGADMSIAVTNTRQLADEFRAADLPIIFTVIAYSPAELDAGVYPWHQKSTGMRSLVQGSEAVALDPRLGAVSTDMVVEKKGASPFFGTGLAAMLSGLRCDTVIVTGATTSGCVRATVVDAVQSGFPTLVVGDAVADRAQAPADAALFDIQEKYGDVVTLADVLHYVTACAKKTGDVTC